MDSYNCILNKIYYLISYRSFKTGFKHFWSFLSFKHCFLTYVVPCVAIALCFAFPIVLISVLGDSIDVSKRKENTICQLSRTTIPKLCGTEPCSLQTLKIQDLVFVYLYGLCIHFDSFLVTYVKEKIHSCEGFSFLKFTLLG